MIFLKAVKRPLFTASAHSIYDPDEIVKYALYCAVVTDRKQLAVTKRKPMRHVKDFDQQDCREKFYSAFLSLDENRAVW